MLAVWLLKTIVMALHMQPTGSQQPRLKSYSGVYVYIPQHHPHAGHGLTVATPQVLFWGLCVHTSTSFKHNGENNQ